MPVTTTPAPSSPARKIAELPKKFPRYGTRKPGDRLPANVVKEVKSVAHETLDYLKSRIAFVQSVSSPTGAGKRLDKIDSEIKSLTAKAGKSEAEYSRLILLERQAADLRAECDEDAANSGEADKLLNNELRELFNLSGIMGGVVSDRIVTEASIMLQPWCLEVSPHQIALSLPKVQQACHSYLVTTYNARNSGLQNARALMSLIEGFLA